ncbi:MAG: phenylacetate--CoA ligase family protein, partial [Pseudomonadota bacterium]
MMDEQRYWNPVLETLSHERLRALQFRKFKRIFRWAYDHSKFHRALYDEAGIAPDNIRSFDDIRHVPQVEKSMMRDVQRKDPFPYGDA